MQCNVVTQSFKTQAYPQGYPSRSSCSQPGKRGTGGLANEASLANSKEFTSDLSYRLCCPRQTYSSEPLCYQFRDIKQISRTRIRPVSLVAAVARPGITLQIGNCSMTTDARLAFGRGTNSAARSGIPVQTANCSMTTDARLAFGRGRNFAARPGIPFQTDDCSTATNALLAFGRGRDFVGRKKKQLDIRSGCEKGTRTHRPVQVGPAAPSTLESGLCCLDPECPRAASPRPAAESTRHNS